MKYNLDLPANIEDWIFYKDGNEVLPAKVIAINYDGKNIKMDFELPEDMTGQYTAYYNNGIFGKDLFLTREEAEEYEQ